MAYTFTLTNAKGGCGKTTTALNLAICFAKAGYRTLAIDLDQQGNLSSGLGIDLNQLNMTVHRLLISEVPEIWKYLIEVRPQLKLLPNSIDIEADDLLEAKKVNREVLLRRQLKPIQSDFDVILIDTPPAMRAATVNALVVADSVIVPILCVQLSNVQLSQLTAVKTTFIPSLLHISNSIRPNAILAFLFSDEEVLMLATLYPKAFPKYQSLPLFGSVIEDYARWLKELGFTHESSRFEIRMVAKMSKYFYRRGPRFLNDLTASDFRACRKAVARHIRDQAGSVNTLKRFLESRGILKADPTVPQSHTDLCVNAYSIYLQKVRGLNSETIEQHVRTSTNFLRSIGFDRAPQRLGTIAAIDLERFIERAGRRLQRGTLQHTVAVLRSFVRFLTTRGDVPPGLDNQIDPPRVYRFEKLPRTLPWKTVQLFLKSIDQNTPFGLRDYTMFLLIATYGLRASDIASLTLDDIRWRKSCIRLVQPKTGNSVELPLTDQVGKAIVRYLKQARQSVPYRHVFLRMVAPIVPVRPQTVTSAFKNHVLRSRLQIRFTGVHCLRHSYATELLHKGTSLKTIGDILGHQCFDSTSVYLRLATADLRKVALSVPQKQTSDKEDQL